MKADQSIFHRIDPIFGKKTPLLFAHRGGALEVPESTRAAFFHARDVAKADVLELDVQITTDQEFVVWHGPKLNNVFVEGVPSDVRKRRRLKNDITEFSWKELKNKAWVGPPGCDQHHLDQSVVRSDDTKLMTLKEFLVEFNHEHLNIEMKDDSFRTTDITKFLEILDQNRNNRQILVASQSRALLDRFRDECNDRYPTSLSVSEALLVLVKGKLPLIETHDMKNKALQSSHHERLTPPSVIQEVKEAGGAVHVFLNRTWILAPALDAKDGEPTEASMFALLDRGVDGVMTDRPGTVRKLIDGWRARE